MKKILRGVYPVFILILLLIGVLIYGFYYEYYLKPVDCGSHPINDCPARCAICPTCPTCDLSCRAIEDCKKDGFYDKNFEQIRTHQSLPDPVVLIKETYEPALKQYPAYDHMVIGECEQATMCVQIYLKEDSSDLKSKMPAAIDGMKVVYVVMEKADAINPVKKDPASGDDGVQDPAVVGKCGIESCHGMEIVCGSNVPDVCTEVYMLGDSCRQFAKCGIIAGLCQSVQSPRFDQCKTCVKKCESDFDKDNAKMFECESGCLQAVK
jgi:hypothetical protein